MRQLTIDPEFRDKIPPLSDDEFQKLEQNILEDGEVREPIVVWRNTIIDGHHRWKIIQEHPDIPYKIKQMDFPDKWAAIVWMCRNQLGRRNITEAQRSYLIGQEYEAQKKTVGGFRVTPTDSVGDKNKKHDKSKIGAAAQKIMSEHGVGYGTVLDAEKFAKGVDSAEKVSPGFKESLLSGEVKAPKSLVSEIRNIPEEKRPAAVEAIKNGDTETAKEIIRKGKAGLPWEKPKSRNPDGYPKERREIDKTIQSVADSMYDTERVVEHTVDDLLEDLNCIINDFSGKTKRSIQNYSTVLQDEDSKEKVIAALSEAETAIRRLKEMIL